MSKLLILTLLSIGGVSLIAGQQYSYCSKVDQNLYATSGEIVSPGYLLNLSYAPSQICKWIIWAPEGLNIKLTFIDLDIDELMYCGGDRITIGSQERLNTFCGSEIPRPIIAKGNLVSVIFYSDLIYSGRGFHIHYEVTSQQTNCPFNYFQCINRNCVSKKNLCDGYDDCGDGSDEMARTCGYQPKIPTELTCGKPKIQPKFANQHLKIIGGDEAREGSWPWMADLQMRLIEPSGHFCGGALIHPQFVLTAAHCTSSLPLNFMKVVLGKHYVFNTTKYEQTRYILSAVNFPSNDTSVRQYGFDLNHDMSLLKLSHPVELNDRVSTICWEDTPQYPLGTECVQIGWGATRGSGNNHVLKQVRIFLDNEQECYDSMKQFNNDTMICSVTRRHGHGACAGDSGGPVVCRFGDQWNIVGVNSMVKQGTMIQPICASKNGATILSSVYHKKKWIRSVISKL